MTKSEEWAYKLCRDSFFSLFSFVNPIGKKEKELCDVIVICGTDIVLISVKEININLTDNYEVDFFMLDIETLVSLAEEIIKFIEKKK